MIALRLRRTIPTGGGLAVDADCGVLGVVRLTVNSLPGEGTPHDALLRFVAATGARIAGDA